MQIHGPVCHSNGIRGFGNEDSKIVLVGIAPGRDEVKSGRPFTGPSGRLLDSVLRSTGFSRDEVYCTNLICYWKDNPSPQEQEACRERLVREIIARKPKLIIPLGALACEAFTNRKLSGKHGARGAVIWDEDWQCYIMPTYHPAGILHALNDFGKGDKSREPIYDLYRDLKKISRVLGWSNGAPLANADYVIVEPGMDVQSILDNLPRNVPVAFDVETYNPNVDEIDVWGDSLLCFSIAAPIGPAYVFPMETIEFLKEHPVEWNNGVRWTFHNAQFDTQIIKKNLDYWIDVHEDTMLQSYTLDERGGIHGLKPLAREYLAAGWWEEAREKGKKRLQDIPREELFLYNAKDAIYTARLSVFFKQEQEADQVRGVYEKILIPAVNAVKEITYRGLRINKRMHMKFAIEWGALYLELEEQLKLQAYEAGWPDREINLQSPDQMSKFLYQHLSLPTGRKSPKTQKYSCDAEELERLRGMHPFVDGFIRYRHMARYYDTYITGFQRHIKDDSRVHPYVKLHGARTGRWSYGDPPLQTIPQTYERDDVESDFNRTREMFVPSSSKYVFIEADFGKGEIWCGYAESKDPQLYEDLMSGDYHTKTAAGVMRKPESEVTKENRRDAKEVTFGAMYWIEPKGLAKKINSSVLQAQMYLESFFKRNKVYREWFWNIVKTVKEQGEIVSPTGRKRRFFILDAGVRELKQAVNYKIQSALGDMTELSLIELHKRFKEEQIDAHVLLQVHDSLLFEVRRDLVPMVCEIIHEVMTQVFFDGYPRLPIEMSIGDTWGTTKAFHDCAEISKEGNKVGCLYTGVCRFDFSKVNPNLLELPQKREKVNV